MTALQRIKNLIECGGGTVWVCQILPELRALVRTIEQNEQQARKTESKEGTLWNHQ